MFLNLAISQVVCKSVEEDKVEELSIIFRDNRFDYLSKIQILWIRKRFMCIF